MTDEQKVTLKLAVSTLGALLLVLCCTAPLLFAAFGAAGILAVVRVHSLAISAVVAAVFVAAASFFLMRRARCERKADPDTSKTRFV